MKQLEPFDARIPSWPNAGLGSRSCPFCDGSGTPILRRPDLLLVRHCETCDCRFVSPAPDEKTLSAFYSSYYAVHASSAPAAAVSDHDFRIRRLSVMRDWRGAAALDVGCGTGGFLHALARLGMSVSGVDVDPSAIESARRLVPGGQLRAGTMSEIDQDARFDLITMNDFIEHPLDPMKVLSTARRLLAPRGALMLYTPNGGHEDNRFPDDITYRRDLEHMQYMTVSTVAFVADHLDLRIQHLETCGVPSGLHLLQSPPTSFRRTVRDRVVAVARRMPGFERVHSLRTRWRELYDAGTYSLFAVLEIASPR